MIEARITMSASTPELDPVLAIASWLSLAMQQEPIKGMTIHSLEVNEVDA